jgi:hypothetical protein
LPVLRIRCCVDIPRAGRRHQFAGDEAVDDRRPASHRKARVLTTLIEHDLAERLRHYATLKDRDPLAYWHHSSEETRAASVFAGQRLEVAFRKPNKSGGTLWGAAYTLSCLQGRPTLDGVTLPTFDRKRLSASVFSLDYRQQTQSVQPAYLACLGDWPYRVTERSGETIRTMRVKPLGGGDNPDKWPPLYFVSQKNPESGIGFRTDLVHFDEPPVHRILQEMRKASYPGNWWTLIITYTPLVRSQWYPLEKDFEGCEGAPHNDRVLVWLNDLRKCKHLSPRDIRELENKYRGDPLATARLTGLPVDASGCSPWGGLYSVLNDMEAEWGREPDQRIPWQIKRERAGDGGMQKVLETVELEVWHPPIAGCRCYVPIDPSLGIEADGYDPGALHVCPWDTGDLWARYNGYIGAYGLGSLGAGVGRQYGTAVVDPETTGGYGGPCLTALSEEGYGNVPQQQIEVMPGKWEARLGFQTTNQSRPAMFSKIQEWLSSYRAGIKYARCPSVDVLRSLKDIILDKNGKPIKAPGLHIEDVILWGQKLRKLNPGAKHESPTQRALPPTRTIIHLGGQPSALPPRGSPSRMRRHS